MKRLLVLSLVSVFIGGMIGCAAQSEHIGAQRVFSRRATIRTRVGVWEEHGVIYSTGVGRSKKRGEARRMAARARTDEIDHSCPHAF